MKRNEHFKMTALYDTLVSWLSKVIRSLIWFALPVACLIFQQSRYTVSDKYLLRDWAMCVWIIILLKHSTLFVFSVRESGALDNNWKCDLKTFELYTRGSLGELESLCEPEPQARVYTKTFEFSQTPSSVCIRLCKHGKRFIFLL